MIFSITNPTELVDWLQIFCKSGWLSPWDPPLQWGKIHEEFTAPQHTRFILPSVSPDKIHRCAAWAVFFFMGNVPWKFHEPSERDTGFPVNAAAKQGQELRSVWTVTHIHKQHNLYLFLRLNNSETTFGNAFWAQRWRARTVPWPQIFNSWKSCAPPGLHICNSCEFWCDLVGACLPQTLLIFAPCGAKERRVVLT